MAGVLRGGKDYQTVFDPEAYLKVYHVETSENWPFVLSYMEALQKIFCQGQVKGERIIEIGCGPTVHSVIPAAKWFDEIFLADFAQINLDAVNKWLARDPQSFNWQSHFEFFAGKDGKRNSWREYEDDVRSKIKKVLMCDFFQPNPLHPENLGTFDAVISVTALMSGTTDIAQYRTAMKNIASLLKPGGFFIEAEAIGCPFYVVGKETFSCLSLTKEDVLSACKESGIDILQTFDEKIPLEADFSKCISSIVVLGRKL